MVAMLASRYIFPKNDSNIKQYKDKRSPAEKYRDIISIINGKLDPELASLWSDLCQFDVAHECFYKSGIAYLERDMKRLQKQFKYEKEIKLDPVINMPDCIKSTEHSIHCEPNNQKCTYMTKCKTTYKDPKELIMFLFHNQKEIQSTLKNKDNAKLLILYLIKNENKFNKFLKRCLVFLDKKCGLSAKKLLRLFRAGCSFLNLAPREKEIRTALISDITSTVLPFAKGFCKSKNISKKQSSQIPISRFLIDSGSDSSILSYKDFQRFNLSSKDLRACGTFNLKGSTGIVENRF